LIIQKGNTMSPVKKIVKSSTKAAPATDALQKGIHSEKAALEAYLRFARNTKNISGKDMFIRLSQDELGHLNLLEKELDSLMTGKQWVKAVIKTSDIEELLPHIDSRQALVQAGEGSSDDLAALNMALEMERKAGAFYKKESSRAVDRNAKAMYARLAEMEEAHFNLIQAELDHIKDLGFWFGIQEFTLEAND
jgi:rubrerythrin